MATRLTDTLTMLSGPGGNVVVLDGADGKVVVDTFVTPAWTALKDALVRIGTAPRFHTPELPSTSYECR